MGGLSDGNRLERETGALSRRSVTGADDFKVLSVLAGKPPLIVWIFRIRLPGVRTVLDGGVEVLQKRRDILVVLSVAD